MTRRAHLPEVREPAAFEDVVGEVAEHRYALDEEPGGVPLASAIPAERRDFAALGQRIAAGVALPPPAPVFPRYVEPETTGGAS